MGHVLFYWKEMEVSTLASELKQEMYLSSNYYAWRITINCIDKEHMFYDQNADFLLFHFQPGLFSVSHGSPLTDDVTCYKVSASEGDTRCSEQ